MKNRIHIGLLTGAAGLAITASGMAGPLTPNHVASDATWVVHMDMEAFVSSPLGQQQSVREIMQHLHTELNGAEANLGIDPARDIKGVTISGVNEHDENALVVVSATSALDAPLARVGELVDDYNAITEGTRTIHSWLIDGQERVYAYVRQGADATERVAVFSGNLDSLRAGMLRVESGPAATMPQALANAAPSPGSFIYFRGSDLSEALGDDAAAMLQNTTAVVFESGDLAGRFFARATLTTPSEEDAISVQQVAQGLYAMARMAASNEPEAKPYLKFMNGFNATVSGATVTLGYENDSAEIGKLISEGSKGGNIHVALSSLGALGTVDVDVAEDQHRADKPDEGEQKQVEKKQTTTKKVD